jgi:hypothetical protein
MGLTAEVELSLRDTGLIDFFDDRRQGFTDIAKASFEYAEGYVSEIGLPLRPDDVAKILVPALTTNEALREFLARKKLRQQYWYRHVADLILDRLWEELTGGAKTAADDAGE